jgi:hypothetical protein
LVAKVTGLLQVQFARGTGGQPADHVSDDEQHDRSSEVHSDDTLIIHGRLTEGERKEEERQKYQKERDSYETAYKNRQITIEEGQLRTNRKIATYTLVLAILTAMGTIVSLLNSQAARVSAEAAKSAAQTASDTLNEVRKGGSDTHDLAEAAKSQSDNTKIVAESAKRSSDTAASALAATRDSNLTTRMGLFDVQRAFIGIEKGMQDNPVQEPSDVPGEMISRQWEFRPKLINSGATPARIVTARYNALQMKTDPPNVLRTLPKYPAPFAGFRFPDAGVTDISDFRNVIGAKEPFTGAAAKVPNESIFQVMRKSSRQFFYGHIEYRDIFPRTPLHISMYCIELTEVRGDFSLHSRYEFVWEPCDRHNCADDECKGEPYGSPTKIWK